MVSNLDKYKADLNALIVKGDRLQLAIQMECRPDDFEGSIKKQFKEKTKDFIASLPSFIDEYQGWYSEAKVLI